MAILGYARVSTLGQSLEVQLAQLEELGCERIYQEKVSGKNAERAELKAMIDYAREGDVVIVCKLDRLARNAIDALTIIDDLTAKGVGIKIMDIGEGTDLSQGTGRFLLTMLAAVAEMERTRILERTNEGRAKAKAEGKHMGRFKDEGLHEKIKEMFAGGVPKLAISKALGCSRQTVYNVLKASVGREVQDGPTYKLKKVAN